MELAGQARELADITDIALTFPSFPDWMVQRENMLHTIDQIFERGYEVVLLDGEAESGKTVALSQFCQRHSMYAFSLFLRPSSKLAYDSAYCRFDLSNQVNWCLKGITVSNKEYPLAADYRILLQQLSQHGRKARKTHYFVIDGICDIPSADKGARAALLDQLPFGLPNIKFLMTGNQQTLPELIDRKIRFREQSISPFSTDETVKLFDGVLDDSKAVADFQRRFSTKPGVLASLRRTLQRDGNAKTLIERIEESKEGILSGEWNDSPPDSPELKLALAAIAFVPTASDIPTLSIVAGTTEAALTEALLKLPYLLVDEQRLIVRFAAEGFIELAKTELAELEKEVVKRSVSAYSDRPIDAKVMQVIPELLERQGDALAYLKFLNRDNLLSIFKSTNSLLSLLVKLNRGQETAERALVPDLAVQYSVDRAVVRSLLECPFPTAQLHATLHLSGPEDAAKIANAQITVEDRLQALCLVVKYQKKTTSVDPTLVAEIERLCELIQADELGDRAIEIASTILHFNPTLAFTLLQRTTNTADGANGLDQSIAKLSIKSLLSTDESRTTAHALRDMLDVKHVDRADQFSALIGLFADEQDIPSLLTETSKLNRTSEKLSILQQWIRRNHRSPDSLTIGEAILKVVLDDPTYVPNASVFRDATLPLTGAPRSFKIVGDLVAIIETQKTILKDTGPLVDYYRTRFHLARAEIVERKLSLTPLDMDALELDDIADLSARASCFAWLHSTIKSIPGRSELKDELGLEEYVSVELRKAGDRLQTESAEHVEVMRPLIRALSGTDDELLCNLIKGVNTVERRDVCYRLAAEYSRSNPYWHPSLASAKLIVHRYLHLSQSEAAKQRIQRTFISWVAKSIKAGHLSEHIDQELLSLAASLHDPMSRARAVLELVESGGLISIGAIDDLVKVALKSAVEDAESVAREKAILYVAASALRKIDLRQAAFYFEEAGGPKLCSDHTEALHRASRVTLKAYANLVKLRSASPLDDASAHRILAGIDSIIVRCGTAATLAMDLSLMDLERAKNFVRSFVRPVIADFQRKGQLKQPIIASLLAKVAPALWIYHQLHTMELLNSLVPEERDEAYCNILELIIFRRTVGDPYKAAKNTSPELTEDSISEALTVLNVVTVDSTFYEYASDLLSAMRDKGNAGRLGKVLIAEFRRRIEAMARLKLPALGGVSHEGYLVLILAQSLANEKSADTQWVSLIQRAKALPNLADAAFVSGELTGIIPSRNTVSRRQAFDASVDLIQGLPLIEDRVDRSQVLIQHGWDVNPERCKQLAKDVLQLSLGCHRDAVRARRLSFVEAVHRVDEELGAALASMAEKHREATFAREEIKERIALIKLGKELTGRDKHKEVEKSEIDSLVQACGRTLALINGGMVVQSNMPVLRSLLIRAGETSLTKSYQLHSFVAQAAYLRYRNKKEGPEYARSLFGAYLSSLEFLVNLLDHLKKRESMPVSQTRTTTDDRFIVTPGLRDAAISWISAWLAATQPSELLIVDAYFGPEDLKAIEIVQREQPDCAITVITSAKVHSKLDSSQYRAAYAQAWRNITFGTPPDVQIKIVSSDLDVTAELHDRWWIGDKCGLTLGTSFNSLGSKLSEIHTLDEAGSCDVKSELDAYINNRRRSASGARLSYDIFTLS